MRKLSVPQLIQRIEYSFIIRASAILVGFGMLITSLSLLVFATFFQSQTKVLTGVNYYATPIVVQFQDQKIQLNAFDTYSFYTNEFGTLKLEIYDVSGNLLSTRKHEVTRAANLMIDILSKDDLAKQCFAQATVTNLFYFNSPDVPMITDLKIISDKGASTLTYEIPAVTETTLFLGNLDGNKLPQTIAHHQRVWGVYPIDCNNINDTQKVGLQILGWSTNNASTQRDIYAEKVREINDSPEYNH